jgi:hypothetical protein
MRYSRSNPSSRYVELLDLYRTMHDHGETFLGIPAHETFPGKSLLPQARHIKRLVRLTNARTVLDYGSGKGLQYEPRIIRDEEGAEWPGILEYWDIDEVVCYDPCYAPYSELPVGTFDGVISTDVLEHCPEEDLPWIVDEIFSFANKFVFANVASYPASKRLPNGENAHCTIRPAEWWRELAGRTAARYHGLVWEFRISLNQETPEGIRAVEQKIGNS